MPNEEKDQALDQIRQILVGKLEDENRAQLGALKADLSATTSQFAKSLEKLSKSISEGLKAQKDSFESFQKAIRKDVDVLSGRVKTLETQLEAVENKSIAKLEVEATGLRKDLDSHRVTVDTRFAELREILKSQLVGREDLSELLRNLASGIKKG